MAQTGDPATCARSLRAPHRRRSGSRSRFADRCRRPPRVTLVAGARDGRRLVGAGRRGVDGRTNGGRLGGRPGRHDLGDAESCRRTPSP
jgi:hypothetical protein